MITYRVYANKQQSAVMISVWNANRQRWYDSAWMALEGSLNETVKRFLLQTAPILAGLGEMEIDYDEIRNSVSQFGS